MDDINKEIEQTTSSGLEGYHNSDSCSVNRIDSDSWGLVLAGGGAKGAYEIGVWRALKELGFEEKITAVSGASVGSLNAVLFAAGDYEKAEEIWRGITHAQILDVWDTEMEVQDFPEKDNIRELFHSVKKSGMFSREGLLDIMEHCLDWTAVFNSSCRIYANASYQYRGRSQAEYFSLQGKSKEEIMDILLASSAMPVVFEPVNIHGTLYRDGGVVDNIPVYPLARDDMKKLIVVKLDQGGYVEKSFYQGREVIEIAPSSDLGDFFSGTVDFSHTNIVKRMEQGYYDALLTLRSYKKQKELEQSGVSEKRKDAVYTLHGVSFSQPGMSFAAEQAMHQANVDAISADIRRNMEYIENLEKRFL